MKKPLREGCACRSKKKSTLLTDLSHLTIPKIDLLPMRISTVCDDRNEGNGGSDCLHSDHF
jgi:hypothetical protein